jgi:CDGSH-type Zn-finger protein
LTPGVGEADPGPVTYTVAPQDNGPYLVTGPLTLTTASGVRRFADGEVVALCRCGRSGNKPFCDATHARTGFDSSATAAAAPESTA